MLTFSSAHPLFLRSPQRGLRSVLLASGIAAATAVSQPAWPQTTAPAAPTSNMNAQSGLASADSSLLTDLAEGNRAEVQAGKLALEKSEEAKIRDFAQAMIDDHGKALAEVESLARQKNVALPDGIGVMHKTKELALKALSGQSFNAQYIKRAGVGDHENTVKLLKKIQAEGKDADLKALADKLLPTVEHHLEMAKRLDGAK